MPAAGNASRRSKEIGLESADGLQHVGGRVLEIRKEKSRDAARSRRGKENYEFYELAKLLPLPAAITSQLDKASIIRLSISYLKLRDFCGHGDPSWNSRDVSAVSKNLKGHRHNQSGISGDLFELHQGAHILQSLDGFAFALSSDGRFIYISETVSIYLGLSQVEMAGSSIFDYVHTQDHQEMADNLGLSLASISSTISSPPSPSDASPTGSGAVTPPPSDRVPSMAPSAEKSSRRSFCIRMKSTLTKRGVHTRTSGYRVVLMLGQFRSQVSFNSGRKTSGPLLGLAGVAIALPPPTITELRIEADTFIMRLTSNFKIIYCENVISTLTDWRSEDVSGKDLYTFCHPGDVSNMKKVHKDLLQKGQVLSPSMRLLNKGGGYIWVQICCTSLYTSKTSDDQTVLAICQTISSMKHRGLVLDASQLKTSDQPTRDTSKQDGDLDLLARADDTPKSSPKSTNSADRTRTLSHSSQGTPDTGDTVPVESTSAFPANIDNEFVLDENIEREDKNDGRLSRRKADRPRKRKRESNGSPSVSLQSVDMTNETSVTARRNSCVSDRISMTTADSMDNCVLNLSSANQSVPNSPGHVDTPKLSQQLPEDLSLGTVVHKMTSNSKHSDKSQHMKAPPSIASSSVHELEKAMSRHLPSRSKAHYLQAPPRSPLDHHWTSPFNFPSSTCSSLSAPFCASTLHTNRESVIRSSLSGRIHGINGDTAAVGMLAPPTTDVTIHKDQLQLHIPHISMHTKHQFHSQKDITSVPDEFGITPPSSVSPQDKMAAASFPDNDISADYLGVRAAQRQSTSGKCQFQGMSESAGEMSKQHFLSVPSYQWHSPEVGAFAHPMQQSSGVVFDARGTNPGLWYGSSHT